MSGSTTKKNEAIQSVRLWSSARFFAASTPAQGGAEDPDMYVFGKRLQHEEEECKPCLLRQDPSTFNIENEMWP
jgi:hypothetical protein